MRVIKIIVAMKKIIFAVILLGSLAACRNNISTPQDELQPQEQIEAVAEEQAELNCGFYHIDFDSSLIKYIPESYLRDSITGVALGYCSLKNLQDIQITIDEIVIEKGVIYLFEDYWGFSEAIRQKTEDSTLVIGEIEILTN